MFGVSHRWHRGKYGALLVTLPFRVGRRAVQAAAAIGALVAAGTGLGWPAMAVAQDAVQELVWPLPPDVPRIRYVGALRSESDIGKKGSFLGGLSRAITGKGSGDLSILRPNDVYAADSMRVFVSDGAAGAVMVFDRGAGEVRIIGGKEGFGALMKPMGLGGDGRGRVYVADPSAHRVVMFGPNEEFLAAFGGPSQLLNPVDVAVDADADRIYVADSYLHQVVVYNHAGAIVQRLGRHVGDLAAKRVQAGAAGDSSSHGVQAHYQGTSRDLVENRGAEPGEFRYPLSVAVAPDGTLYVSDGLNFRVQAFDREGTHLFSVGRLGDTPGSLARPKGIAVDPDGHLYVVDGAFNNLQVFDGQGQLLMSFGSVGVGPGQFWLPMGIHIDRHGTIYVADRYNDRIQMFQYLSVEESATDTREPN